MFSKLIERLAYGMIAIAVLASTAFAEKKSKSHNRYNCSACAWGFCRRFELE